jgi:hypothetical protein
MDKDKYIQKKTNSLFTDIKEREKILRIAEGTNERERNENTLIRYNLKQYWEHAVP